MALKRIPPDLREDLEQTDPELLRELESEESKSLDADYPKPELGDLRRLQKALESEWSDYEDEAERQHKYRYLQDDLDPKQKRYLETNTRVNTRFSHNEILRVVSILTRNPYQVQKPPKGPTDKDYDRAEKQERWGQAFFPYQERRAKKPLRRILLDGSAHLGLAAWEVFLTGSYDRLDFEKDPEESDKQFLRRTEDQLIGADSPIGIRPVHAMTLKYRRNAEGDGLDVAMIIEKKPYKTVYERTRKRLSSEAFKDLAWPEPGTEGVPRQFDGVVTSEGEVETVRYYDKRWYAYMVAGKLVDGPHEHGMPGVPVFPVEGIVTSSPNPQEAIEGVTWGMHSIEKAYDDLLTLGVDVAYVFSRPRPVIETAPNGTVTMDRATQKPAVVDLSNPRVAIQLNRGQKIVDAFSGFKPNYPEGLIAKLEQLWQRSGLNPIAQGTSPGADPAGYTVNSLMGAANDMYGILLENDARVAGELLDFVLATIKYTIGEKCYMPVPGTGKRSGSIEWLAIGPEDIDEIPFVVTIDPTSEANRLARVQTLLTGWQAGLVPPEEVQEKGYGAEDTDEWNRRITLQDVKKRLVPILADLAVQETLQSVMPQAAAPPGGPTAANGQEAAANAPGVEPAPTQEPSLGAETAQASGAPSRGDFLNPARATAGQDNGFRPPPGSAERSV